MTSASPKLLIPAYIDLPDKNVAQSSGLGMDIGGSVIKIAYLPKDKSPRQGEPPIATGRQRIRLVQYSRQDLDKALKETAEMADIRRSNDKDVPVVFTSGIGSNEHKKKITEALNIETSNKTEFDMFISCFKELCNILPKKEINDALHEEGENEANKLLSELSGFLKDQTDLTDLQFKSNDVTVDEQHEEAESRSDIRPYAEEDQDLFPCHIAMLGTGFATMQINKDGTFALIDGNPRGGGSFLGIGRLLTGADTYDELISLAEAGDDKELNVYIRDFNINKSTSDMYTCFPDDLLCYAFGKAKKGPTGNYRKESIAKTLAIQYATDITQVVKLGVAASGVNNVFFCGNFCNADIIRKYITKFLMLGLFKPKTEKPIQYHFLKHGGFYGALGALLLKSV